MYRGLILGALLCLPISVGYAHSPVENPAQYVTEELKVSGLVKTPLFLNVESLKHFPHQSTQRVAINTLKGQVRSEPTDFTGVLLTDILNQAEIIRLDHNDVKKMLIVAIASDGYKAVFSWNELFNSATGQGVMVIYQRDNKPLDERTGQIALISTRDLATGPRFVKWLKQIKVIQLTELDQGE